MVNGSKGRYLAGIALSFCALMGTQAWADTGVALSGGQSQVEDKVWRLGFRGEIDRTLWTSAGGAYTLKPQWDIAYTRWSSIDVDTVSFSPALRLTKPTGDLSLFLDGGIGLAYFSRTVLTEHRVPSSPEPASRDLGSRLNFEDRLGAGVIFDNGTEVGLRFFHYSNADVELPNDGINAYYLNVYFPF